MKQIFDFNKIEKGKWYYVIEDKGKKEESNLVINVINKDNYEFKLKVYVLNKGKREETTFIATREIKSMNGEWIQIKTNFLFELNEEEEKAYKSRVLLLEL